MNEWVNGDGHIATTHMIPASASPRSKEESPKTTIFFRKQKKQQ